MATLRPVDTVARDQKLDDVWNLVGYVRSSQYRDDTISYLAARGPAMPSEISEASGNALPHISRALSELRDREVVELLVPENTQRGRIYGLTEYGQDVAANHMEGRQDFEWTLIDEEEFPYRELLDYVKSETDGALVAAAYREGRKVSLVGSGDAPLHEYGPLVEGPARGELAAWNDVSDPKYLIGGFDGCLVVQFPLGPDRRLGVGIDDDVDIPVPSFVRGCRSLLN